MLLKCKIKHLKIIFIVSILNFLFLNFPSFLLVRNVFYHPNVKEEVRFQRLQHQVSFKYMIFVLWVYILLKGILFLPCNIRKIRAFNVADFLLSLFVGANLISSLVHVVVLVVSYSLS